MFLLFFLTILVVSGDQMLKIWVINNLALHEELPFIPGVLDLTFAKNTGAAWSMFSDKIDFLVVISIFAIFYFLSLIFKHRKNLGIKIVIYPLIIGGAIGNLIDRIRLGFVIDMFELKIFSFPIFNIADAAICIGIFLLIMFVFKYGEEDIL